MSEEQRTPLSPFAGRSSSYWLLLALVLVLIQAIPNISYPIGRDQATYCVIGRGLHDGARLYRDLWDNKPPGIFYIYAAIVRIFGTAMWSVGMLDILWLLAISACIFRFVENTLGKGVAFIAVLVNAAMHIRAGYWDAAQPETFLMLFIFGSYFLLSSRARGLKPRQAAAGLLFATAFWIKYNAVAFLPFLVLAPYLQTRKSSGWSHQIRLNIEWPAWRGMFSRFAAGFVFGSVAFVFRLLFSGAWSGFVEEQFKVLPRYAAVALVETPHYWSWAAGRIESWLGLWTLCAAQAAIVLAWKRRDLPRLAPALVGAVGGFTALALQIRYQPYYFETCYPFFAIFWAYLGIQLFEAARFLVRFFLERNWRVACGLTWVVFANVVALCLPGPVVRLATNYQAFFNWQQNPARFYSTYSWPGAAEDFRDVLRVVDYLNRHPAASNGVYVWGNEPLIYFLSGHRPPSRFVWNLALIAPWRLPGWRTELIRRLSRVRPRFIVVAHDDAVPGLSGRNRDSAQVLQEFPGLRNYLRDFYQPCKDDVTFEIYCRAPRNVAAASTGPAS